MSAERIIPAARRSWPGLVAIRAVTTGVAFANALAVAARLEQTSDSANSFVAGQAIAGGNLLLSGWHFPLDDYYFTDAVPYAVLEWLSGPAPFLLVLFPALIYALFAGAALLASLVPGRPPSANIVSAAVIVLLLGAPPWTGRWNPLLLSDMHVASVLGGFVALALAARIAGRGNGLIPSAVGLVIITCAVVASDPFAIVFAFAPALAILAVEAFARPGSRARLAFALLGAGTLGGVMLVWFIAQRGGFTTEYDILTRVQTLALLKRNLIAVAMGSLALFGANPLVGDWGFRGGLLLVIRGIGLVLAILAIQRTIRHAFDRERITLFDLMLCAGILTVLAACLFSAQFARGITPENLWTGGPPMRFLVPACLFAAVLAGRQAPDLLGAAQAWRIGRVARAALVLAAAIIVFGGYWLSRLGREPVWIAGNPPSVAARWLKSHGLVEGVGEYWSASLVTAMSGNAVRVRGVVPVAGRLVSYIWAADAGWYAAAPQFVVWQDHNRSGITSQVVRATYKVERIAVIAGFWIAILSPRHSDPR